MTLVVGFSGIAGILWEGDMKTTKGKLEDGRPLGGTWFKLKTTALRETGVVVENKGRPCCIGPTIAEKYKIFTMSPGKSLFSPVPQILSKYHFNKYMNILVFGDSITWGSYDPNRGGWVTRLRNYYEKKDADINVYNLGIPGNTTIDLLKRVEFEASSRNPDIIIFAIGINDAQLIRHTNGLLVSIQEFRQNLSRLFFMARNFTNKVVFVGLTVVDESKTNPDKSDAGITYRNENIRQFDKVIEHFCRENRLKYIKVDGTIGNNDLVDGLHPNPKGHRQMFEKIKTELETIL